MPYTTYIAAMAGSVMGQRPQLRVIVRHKTTGQYFCLRTDDACDWGWTWQRSAATDFLTMHDAVGALVSRKVDLSSVDVDTVRISEGLHE